MGGFLLNMLLIRENVIIRLMVEWWLGEWHNAFIICHRMVFKNNSQVTIYYVIRSIVNSYIMAVFIRFQNDAKSKKMRLINYGIISYIEKQNGRHKKISEPLVTVPATEPVTQPAEERPSIPTENRVQENLDGSYAINLSYLLLIAFTGAVLCLVLEKG